MIWIYYPLQYIGLLKHAKTLAIQRKRFRRFIFFMINISLFNHYILELWHISLSLMYEQNL